MKKQIKVEVLNKQFELQPKWKDVKAFGFEDNDLIQCVYDVDECLWFFIVERFREETDKECDERVKMEKFQNDEMRKRRYEQFLKLQKEFNAN